MIVKLKVRKPDEWSGLLMHKNCYQLISTYYTRTGRYYTGLDDEDAERLGELLHEDLHPNSDFWDTFDIRVFSTKEYVVIDTSDPLGELQYKFLKNHKDVANGLRDKKPGARFVMIHEESEASTQNIENRIKTKAILELAGLSPNEKRKCLRLYGVNADNTDIEIVESKLFTMVENDPKRFMRVWVDNASREIEHLIHQAISKNVVRKKNTAYYYGADVLGYTMENAVEYLSNPANNDVKIAILSQIEGKEILKKADLKEESDSQAKKLMKQLEKKETKKSE